MSTPKTDFEDRAKRLALNEACDMAEVKPGDCTIDHLCPFCAALAKTIQAALNSAYAAGVAAGMGAGR